MTAFFVGGLRSGGSRAEHAYGELRELSQEISGCPARARRIFQLRCRLDGADAEIEVGKAIASGDAVVAAIIDHGRHESFIVHMTPARDEPLRVPNPVYSVTEFATAS